MRRQTRATKNSICINTKRDFSKKQLKLELRHFRHRNYCFENIFSPNPTESQFSPPTIIFLKENTQNNLP